MGLRNRFIDCRFTCQRRMVGGKHSVDSNVEVRRLFVAVQKLLEP